MRKQLANTFRTIAICTVFLLSSCISNNSSIPNKTITSEDNSLHVSNITVTGEGVEMFPNFNAETLRYGVHSTNETSSLTVSAIAKDGESIVINGVTISSGTPVKITDYETNSTISIELQHSESNTKQVYELMILPIGYPKMNVTTFKPDKVANGNIFLNPTGNAPFFTIVMNNQGIPEFVRETKVRSGVFLQHPNGFYSYNERLATGEISNTNERIILNKDFNEVNRLTVLPPLTNTDSHDFLIPSNGNHVFLSYEPIEHGGKLYQDSVIQEVDPETGKVVFQWNSWGVIPVTDQLSNNKTDYAHINSIIEDLDGNFIVSLRGTSQIVKINRISGKIMWKLGGISNEFKIDDPLGGPCGQHNVTRLESGNILLFDNGVFCPNSYPERGKVSRAIEYALDEENKIATLVWSYSRDDTFGKSGGSAQRFPNGNTLIGWGGNPTGPSATEVDSDGNVVYELYVERDKIQGSNRVLRY